MVFPTPVGVFPLGGSRAFNLPGLPHARGGVSHALAAKALIERCLPHARGGVSKKVLAFWKK